MENQKEHFRHILLFYFRKGKNASQAHKKLCAVYGDEALKERQCQNWFAKFRSGDFSLNDEKRSGRPVEVEDEQIKAIIDSDRHSSTREIAEKLHVSHTCIENRLKQLGYVRKLDVWVPHELKEIHLTQRIHICDLLNKRNENDPFLKRLITGDEKWVLYNNVNRKRSWSGPNWQIEKVLFSIMTMQGHTHLWSLGKNYWSLVGMFCHIHHIVQTLHHLITFCFDPCKTP